MKRKVGVGKWELENGSWELGVGRLALQEGVVTIVALENAGWWSEPKRGRG